MNDKKFLPTTKKEMDELGWGQPDFIYVSGDAYVDHPSFGASIITRVLEDAGVYKRTPEGHCAFLRFIATIR